MSNELLGRSVKRLWLLSLLLLVTQISFAQTTFTKPSEAYESAHRELTEWDEALRARKPLPGAPPSRWEFMKRASKYCAAFEVGKVSGEELYWLAKLCEEDHPKALVAIERYLAGSNLTHAPDARLVLAVQQMRAAGSWEAAWGTFRIILQEDPYPPVESQLDGVIDDESDLSEAKALEWSKQRYAILLDRITAGKPGEPSVPAGSVISAGADLVHRYYLAGDSEEAAKLLGELNDLAKSHAGAEYGWGVEDLFSANMEMQPAPAIDVLKKLGANSSGDLLQEGRVEVVSFFFLGCAPCIQEMPNLNKLQERYGSAKLLAVDVTSYKANSYLGPPSDSHIEGELEKARLANAPGIDFVIASEGTLASYGVHGFPVVVFVDKKGRLRFAGRPIEFRENESADRLIQKLLAE